MILKEKRTLFSQIIIKKIEYKNMINCFIILLTLTIPNLHACGRAFDVVFQFFLAL